MRQERKDLQEEKLPLVKAMAAGNQTLHHIEQEILQLLASTTGTGLLNDDVLVATLEASKRQAQDHSEKLKSATETEKKIDTACECYRMVASRAAQLFVVLSNRASA
jgi:dynein heavy chain